MTSSGCSSLFKRGRLAIKRLLDVIVSASCLLVLAIPLLLLVICVRFDSPGPGFFRQRRIGKGGKPFNLLKLRTMVVNAESMGRGLRVAADDERITRVGRWLRAFGIDELPQLVNVFRGEMSLVGPRPTVPLQVENYTERQRRRLEMRPGITGLAILRGRKTLTWLERIEVDIEYVERWSLRLDLEILLKTPWVVLIKQEGVYAPPESPAPPAWLYDAAAGQKGGRVNRIELRKRRYERSDIERHNAARTEAFQADPCQYEFLDTLNAELSTLESRLTAELTAPQHAVVFVVGVPRSGSSFLYQLIAGTDQFAYVSNFSARFWRAPHVGCSLEKALGLREQAYEPDYKSEFGKMFGLQAPHEFQYFWDQWFAQGQPSQALGPSELAQVDVAALRRSIAGIEAVWQKPVLLKSLFWFAHQIGFLSEALPRSVFANIRRDPLFVAQSVAVARRRIFGDIEHWWGPRPREHEELAGRPWADQIMGQVFYTAQAIREAASELPEARFIDIEYEEFCAAPMRCLDLLQESLADLGETVDFSGVTVQPSDPSKKRQLPEAEFEALRGACECWYGSAPEGARPEDT